MQLSAAIVMVFCLFPTFSLSQEIDSTDLSRYEIFDENDTTPDLMNVGQLEDEYKAALKNSGCKEALPKIIAFAKNANFAANIIRRGNKPYYDARRDDQTNIASDRLLLRELISAENVFNGLIYQRNKAWVAEARCLIELDDKDAAVVRLMRALDLISGTSEKEVWEEARTLLWAQIGFVAE
jgi:hypothetical protein